MSGKTPFAQQRMELILTTLAQDGRVDVGELAGSLGVSNESVRKDLVQLESQGRLQRVHGGAIPVQLSNVELDVEARRTQSAEKLAIARAALKYVPAGGSILIDAGSTTAQLAALLPADPDLVVYTNTLPIAMIMLPKATVYTLGGRVRRPTGAEVGPVATATLTTLNVDVSFLGTNGLSVERGLTSPDPDEAAVKRLMFSASRRRILLVDHTKFGLRSLCQHAEITDVDLVITDSGTPPEDLDALRSAGVDVEVAR